MKLSTALLLSLGLVSTNVFAAMDDSSTSMSTTNSTSTTTMPSKCDPKDTKCMDAEAAAAKAADTSSTTSESTTTTTNYK